MSRFGVCFEGMTDSAVAWEKSISSCRRMLATWLRDSADSRQIVAELLQTIEELDRIHKSSVAPTPGSGQSRSKSAASPSNAPGRFRIERTNRGSYLAEHFSSARLPFRCPEPIYFTTAKVLGNAKNAVSFDEILQAVRTAEKDTLPDYLVRVCIRFWLTGKSPLIQKVRSSYRPIHPGTFVRDAKRAWQKLAD